MRVMLFVLAVLCCIILNNQSVNASELAPVGYDPVSIWDIGSNVFDWIIDTLDDYFTDNTLDDYQLSDLQIDMVKWAVSQYVAAEDTTIFNQVCDYVINHPGEFDIELVPNGFTFDPRIGLNFYDNLKAYIDSTFVLAEDFVSVNGYHFAHIPPNSSRVVYKSNGVTQTVTNNGSFDVYVGIVYINLSGSTYQCDLRAFAYSGIPNCSVSIYGSLFSSTGNYNGSYASGYYRGYRTGGENVYNNNFENPLGLTEFSNVGAATIAFFGGPVEQGGSEPDGSVYVRPYSEPIKTDLPRIVNNNYEELSTYYYNTYGDQYAEGAISYNNYYLAYDIINYNYSLDVPYWLVNGNKDVDAFEIYDHDFDLQLYDDFEVKPGFIAAVLDVIPEEVMNVLLILACGSVIIIFLR